MSGVEIAGLALGAFPLLIAVLEHWKKCAEVAGDWWSIRSEVTKCIHDLKCAELALRRNLEKLLLPIIILGDDEIQELMKDSEGDAWKDTQLEQNLRDRLPESYGLFRTTVQEMNLLLSGLRRELGIDKPGFMEMVKTPEHLRKRSFRLLLKNQEHKTNKSSKLTLEAHLQRLKFGFGRANRIKLFTELNHYNATLREILASHEETATLRKARETTNISLATDGLWSLWRHACSLFDLLTGAIRCHCRHMHSLQLRLRHQVRITEVEFYLWLFYNDDNRLPCNSEDNCPWNARYIKAKKEDLDNQRFIVPNTNHQAPKEPATQGIPLIPALRPSKLDLTHSNSTPGIKSSNQRARVGFDTAEVDLQPTISSVKRLDNSFINDLCDQLSTSRDSSHCIGSIGEDNTIFSIYTMQEHDWMPGLISLGDLLRHGSKFKLSRRNRYNIALIIASSHLQLGSSGWIGTSWTKNDIFFQLPEPGAAQMEFQEPYIWRRLAANASESLNAYPSIDRTLQTLGILLIELCHGEALEDQATRKEYAKMNDSSAPGAADLEAALDLAIALQWAETVLGEGGERFAQAVDWCLRSRPSPPGGNSKWRKEMFTNVVEPLQFCNNAMSSF